MIPLNIKKQDGLKILCLGAHCDDIEIGCGGTLLKMSQEERIADVKWVVFTSTEVRKKEAENSANFFLTNASHKEILVNGFQDGILPQQTLAVKEYFEELKKTYSPDFIFTHYRADLHQDHRLINELTWNTFRNHFILEYEIQKFDGDIGNPGMYVSFDAEIAKRKVEGLLTHYPSQASKHWFDQETFFALMRLRGLESVSRYAEAFYMRKGILF